MSRLGVFGSSFNPPTLGHVVLLVEASWRLDLDRVIVVPTGQAWHKDTDDALSGRLRLAMTESALGGMEKVEISSTEIERDGPSYTCDTLEEIQDTNPDSQIYLLAGSDAAQGIGGWHRPERVLELARLAVAPRSGLPNSSVTSVVEAFGGSDRVEFFEMPEIDISSSLARERIKAGHPWEHLVPQAVAEMINNEGLYGSK